MTSPQSGQVTSSDPVLFPPGVELVRLSTRRVGRFNSKPQLGQSSMVSPRGLIPCDTTPVVRISVVAPRSPQPASAVWTFSTAAAFFAG